MVNRQTWKTGDPDGNTGTCEMFDVIGGVATCTIHLIRPDICRDYPMKNKKCMRQRDGD
jgi:Fe-S-cluster containining protein